MYGLASKISLAVLEKSSILCSTSSRGFSYIYVQYEDSTVNLLGDDIKLFTQPMYTFDSSKSITFCRIETVVPFDDVAQCN